MPVPTLPIERFLRAEGGHVAVITALCMTVLLGFTALGVDTAALYRERAALQAASDLAAMSAMGQPEAADLRAEAARARNAGQASVTALTQGRYLRNPALAPEARFTPLEAGDPQVNAVRLSLGRDAPLHFARIFTEASSVALTTTATASRTGAASFSLTSHLARLDLAALNDALSTALALEVSLSVNDRDILAAAQVSTGALMEEVARISGFAARNPAEIMAQEVTVQAVIQALAAVMPAGSSGPVAPLASVSAALSMEMAGLIAGIDTGLGLTASDFAAEVQVSALEVLQAVVAARIGAQAIGLDISAPIPGVTALDAALTLGEAPDHSGWVALGEENITLHRAAARLQLDVALDPALLGNLGTGVTASNLRVPLHLELAGASATLQEIACAEDDPLAARFSTAATALHPANGTSAAALYLGSLPAGTALPVNPALLDFAPILDLDLVIAVPLLPAITLGGLSVEARADLALGSSQVESVSWSRAQVAAGDRKRVFGSGALLGTAMSGLLDPANTEIRLKTEPGLLIPALAVPVLDSVMALLPERLLSGLATPLDTALDAALASAGLQVGAGELTLHGHHCELIRLVH